MNRTLPVFGILVLIICCKSIELKKNSELERYVSVFNETNSKQEKFTGETSRNGNIYLFEYRTEKDSLRSLKFDFNEKTNQLFFNRTEFYNVAKKKYTFEDKSFKYYKHKTLNKGLILFNEKYGVLAISNLYGPSLIFLQKKERHLNTEKLILKILNE
jgi:hypothetical protein